MYERRGLVHLGTGVEGSNRSINPGSPVVAGVSGLDDAGHSFPGDALDQVYAPVLEVKRSRFGLIYTIGKNNLGAP